MAFSKNAAGDLEITKPVVVKFNDLLTQQANLQNAIQDATNFIGNAVKSQAEWQAKKDELTLALTEVESFIAAAKQLNVDGIPAEAVI